MAESEGNTKPTKAPLTERVFASEDSSDRLSIGNGEEFLAVFLHAPIPIYLVDPEGQVQRANRVKNPRRNASGKPSREIGYVLGCLHALQENQCGQGPYCLQCPVRHVLRETLRKGRCYHRQEVSLRIPAPPPNKSDEAHVLLSTMPLWINGNKMILVYVEDITALRQSQNQLELFNRNLEELVDQRTVEVQSLLDQKKAFIRQLGHDLRTPLTPFIALLPMLREKLRDAKGREILELIINNAEYMRQLVSKTLEWISLDHPGTQPEFQEVPLAEAVAGLLAEHQSVLRDQSITAESRIPSGLRVRADVTQFKEVLLNLLGNAVKFMDAGGRLTITAQPEETCVVLAVTDTGRGMLSTELPHIFEEFYKADSSRHDRKSPGLGLAICKRIVENHGGRIWAQSPGLGKGTTLFFTLPIAPAGSEGETKPPLPEQISSARGASEPE